MKTSLFIGRWQVPELHAGHRALIWSAIGQGHHVVIGIRDTALDEDNPYTVEERMKTIRFGQPSLLMLDTGEILAFHWAVIEGQGKILSHRLRLH